MDIIIKIIFQSSEVSDKDFLILEYDNNFHPNSIDL